MLRRVPSLFCKCIGKVWKQDEDFFVCLLVIVSHSGFSSLQGVQKTDTHRAGIICRAASISATSVLITTIEGKSR